jgi:hypothetical protein
MGRPLLGLSAHITTPIRQNGAVHHSKNCALMSQIGHSRRFKREVGMAASPQ